MICNYHTHTYRCKHARGDIDDYIAMAIKHNVNSLGISDHSPLPDNRWLEVRMHMDELSDYSHAIDVAKLRYRDKIHLLKGMECDWAPEYADFYRNTILKEYNFDYVIGASHWFPFKGEWQMSFNITMPEQVIAYAEFLAEAIQAKLFSFIAHPDVFCSQYEWDDTAIQGARLILKTAREYGMPLEINGYGFRKPQVELNSGTRPGYPYLKFWELASEYNIQVICNSDAHLPQDIISGIADAQLMAQQCHLQQVIFDS